MSMAGLKISVVMATYKRPDLLERCLRALCDQSLAGDAYEILVVDDGHDPATRALVESFWTGHGGAPAVRYLESRGTRGPAGARNVGWRGALAPIVAFTDDDTVPQRDWLRAGLAAVADERTAVVGRTLVPRAPEYTDHARMTEGLQDAEFITANAFVPRALLVEVDGFDERFTRPWREDSDLQFKLLGVGAKIVRAADAVVEHPVRAAPWGISLGQQRNAFFEALLYKKHPQAYRTRVTPRVPWRYYLIVACVLACLVSLACRLWWPAACSFAVALLATLDFALRRLAGTSRTLRHVGEMLATSFAIPFLSIYWRLRGAWHFRVPFL